MSSAPPQSTRSWLTWLGDETIRYEGSTRTAAIVRIFVPLVIWARIGDRLLLFKVHEDPEMLIASLIFWSSSLAVMAGCLTRVAAPLLAIVMTWFYVWHGLHDNHEDWRTIQQFWAIAAWLPFCASGGSFSVDRWWALRRAARLGLPPPPEHGNLMGLRLIAIQISLIYAWGASDKLDVPFFRGERIDRLFMHFYGSSDYPRHGLWRPMLLLSSWGTVGSEIFLAFGLWWDKTRRWAVLLGIFVHAAFYVTLPVSSFSLMMWTGYLAFVPPDRAHRFIDEHLGHGGTGPGTSQPPPISGG